MTKCTIEFLGVKISAEHVDVESTVDGETCVDKQVQILMDADDGPTLRFRMVYTPNLGLHTYCVGAVALVLSVGQECMCLLEAPEDVLVLGDMRDYFQIQLSTTFA